MQLDLATWYPGAGGTIRTVGEKLPLCTAEAQNCILLRLRDATFEQELYV